MKRIILFIAMGVLLSACNKHLSSMATEAAVTFEKMFPKAWNIQWEREGGLANVEFRDGLTEREAWFQDDGTWVRTKTDITVSQLPQVVSQAVKQELGTGWRIDDADHYLSSTAPEEYYLVECEQIGFSDNDRTLIVAPDGTIISGNAAKAGSSGQDPAGQDMPFSSARQNFQQMYPDAVGIEWEHEFGMLNVQFMEGRYEKEAWYKEDGHWVCTKTEIPLAETPEVVKNAVRLNLGTNWIIDDVDHYLAESDPVEYYIVECEAVGSGLDRVIKISGDGTLLHIQPTSDEVVVNPSVEPGTTPAVDPGTTPAVQPGTTPAVDPGTTPSVQPGTTPSVDPGTTPAVQPGTTPAVEPGNTGISGREAAEATFAAMYPAAFGQEWELERGMLNVEFREGSHEKEAWFRYDGTWALTKTELRTSELPKVVYDAVIGSLGAVWRIDEADHYLSSTSPEEYYIIECEKPGFGLEAFVKVLPDGTVLEKREYRD